METHDHALQEDNAFSTANACIMPLKTRELGGEEQQKQQETNVLLCNPSYFVNASNSKEQQAKVLRNEQKRRVIELVASSGFIPCQLVENEVNWFYENLGIDDLYFANESDSTICGHVITLYAAKLNAFVDHKDEIDINLVKETESGAVYIHTTKLETLEVTSIKCERTIDAKYLDLSNEKKAFKLQMYRSHGCLAANNKQAQETIMRCYFVSRCQFTPPQSSPEYSPFDIKCVADVGFLEKATFKTLELYQKMIINVLQREGPVIEVYDTMDPLEKRLVIGCKQETSKGFFSFISDLYHFYGLYSRKKYVEQFANGVTIMSIYFSRLESITFPPLENSIMQIMKELSLVYCIPSNPLQTFFQQKILSVQEMVYGFSALVFTQHFLNRLGNEYEALQSVLDSSNPSHVDVLTKLKKRLRQDTFTREYVLDIVKMHPELIKILYQHFGLIHYVSSKDSSQVKPTLSFVRLHSEKIWTEGEIRDKIKRVAVNSHEQMVFESFLTFNLAVLKTNFYQPTKIALSFRLDPAFLPSIEYPVKPFGMFLVIGSEFRGFHVRFQDVARGGIRIIKSRNKEAYSINFRGLFDENYALAATQQRKNKDIPEGGSKGTILLDFDAQDKDRIAFEKYIDSMIDLLVVEDSPGIKERLVDLWGPQEIIFFGPDEGSALYMDWASEHAKARGVPYWRAFTTGKSWTLGGIPHDKFGMTTRSIHQYVLGIYRKLGLQESEVTKIQTGGPDGDLGSNEIKISRDRTIAIIDGSGVLYDPGSDGKGCIDRQELIRLANSRLPVSHFNTALLSPKGFLVLVEHRSVTLPGGILVEDGLKFRNEFHFSPWATADLFVPCGGRPESVDVSNWERLLWEGDGTPKFRFIVEGANLFFTQEARLRLEKAGCVIFKDASANKGGVTSSSMEVLASLCLSDLEFDRMMRVKVFVEPVCSNFSEGGNQSESENQNNNHFHPPELDQNQPNAQIIHNSSPQIVIPPFYSKYIECVYEQIERNAELEFEAIWREFRRSGKEKSKYSDELSLAITTLDQELQFHTPLFENLSLRKLVLSEAIPQLLLQNVEGGLDVILDRVPESYLRAMFGSWLASRFIYAYGTEASQFAFFEFMTRYYRTGL